MRLARRPLLPLQG